MVRLEIAILLHLSYVCCANMCQVVRYVFGDPLPSTEKAVFYHKVGFSREPFRSQDFELGVDCVCESIACYRRQSEYCIEPASKDDPYTQTWKSYDNMNPYTKYIGVVLLLGLPPGISIERLGLLVRTCYPYVTVYCMFRGDAFLFPWMRECCDAIVLPSKKIQINETQILFSRESEDQRDETTIFTITDIKLNCNKCGIATSLKGANFDEPGTYVEKQTHPEGKNLSIVVRNREAYLTLKETDEPFKIRITGGFEPTLVRHIAAALNFSFFYIGNLSTLTTGGGINKNGTFDGMLDMLMKRTAIVSLSNQKPIHPGDELFSYTNCYDVDIMPFASRIEFFPVTMHELFDSIGNIPMMLVALSTIVFSLMSYLLLRIRHFHLGTLVALIWFYSSRLFNSGFKFALLNEHKIPDRLRGLVVMWAFKALIFSAMFGAVWVTFVATPSVASVVDTFTEMMRFIVKKNSTCFMSSGLVGAGFVYGKAAKPIFDRAKGTSNATMILHELQNAKNHPFWFYERMFIVYQLNKFAGELRSGDGIHISRDSFIMQPQCWIIQKNCALIKRLSIYLSHYLESGLMLQLQRRYNVSSLPRRIVDNSFIPLKVHQLDEIFVFAAIAPLFVTLIFLCEMGFGRRVKSKAMSGTAPRRRFAVEYVRGGPSYVNLVEHDPRSDDGIRTARNYESNYLGKLKHRDRVDSPGFHSPWPQSETSSLHCLESE